MSGDLVVVETWRGLACTCPVFSNDDNGGKKKSQCDTGLTLCWDLQLWFRWPDIQKMFYLRLLKENTHSLILNFYSHYTGSSTHCQLPDD